MAQGMDDKIRQISEMLSSQEAQEGIRQLFSSFGASRDTSPMEEGLTTTEMAEMAPPQSSTPAAFSLRDSDWLYNIQNLLGQMNNVQDSRVNLLRSVHPFLNPTRRERCTTCMNILKIASMLRAFTSNGGRLL